MRKTLTAFIALFALVITSCFIFITDVLAQAKPSWDKDWKYRVQVVLQETAGLDRTREPVDVEIEFTQPLSEGNAASMMSSLPRELRVVEIISGGSPREIPSQVYDIKPLESKSPSEASISARVVFFAEVKAGSSAAYHVYYGNPRADAPRYKSGLDVSGEGVKYAVENSYWRILTEEKSGQIDQIDLKFATRPSFRFVHGTLHWNPDFILIADDYPIGNYKWWYSHHFVEPEKVIESGPLFFSIKRSQLIPGQDVIFMEVYYRFYDGLPYFISETRIETKKDCRTFAIRNDELAFGTTDFSYAGWRNKTPDLFDHHMGEIGSTSIYHEMRTGSHVLGSALPANIAWISLSQPDSGYAVGSIRLEWENVNILTGEPAPIYNSRTVLSEHGGGLYWFRSLVYSPRRPGPGQTRQDLIRNIFDIPEGSSYYEKNAYLMYETDKEVKFDPIDETYMRLRTPLEVRVVR